MRRNFAKNNFLFFYALVIAIITIVSIAIASATTTVTLANPAEQATKLKSDTLTIGHVTDVHYFPLEYCYAYTTDENGKINPVDKNSKDFKNSDFTEAVNSDTKLVSESGAILTAFINSMLTNAKKIIAEGGDLDQIPDVLLATGDLSKHSERVALVDVANAFRFLQNKMRTLTFKDSDELAFPNFQIFVIPGNHDMFNSKGKLYNNDSTDDVQDGSKLPTDTLNTSMFAQIFAGLGYPDADQEIMSNVFMATKTYNIGGVDYTYSNGRCNESYWSGALTGNKYIYSSTAKNLSIKYYSPKLTEIYNMVNTYRALDKNATDYSTKKAEIFDNMVTAYSEVETFNNVLSYYVDLFSKDIDDSTREYANFSFSMCDSSDRAYQVDPDKQGKIDKNVPVSMTSLVVASPIEIDNSKNNLYTIEKENGKTSIKYLGLSYIDDAIKANKQILFDVGLMQNTGGKISTQLLDWLENTAMPHSKNLTSIGDVEPTLVFASHHNILPHYSVEDKVTKDFTVYNWEYVANRLINMGVRSTYSGHKHDNDIASYTDSNGKVIFDYETGSSVSYTGPYRINVYDRDVYQNQSSEKFLAEDINSKLYQNISLKEIPSSNIVDFFNGVYSWEEVDVSDCKDNNAKFQKRFAKNQNFFTYCNEYDKLKNYSYNDYSYEALYQDFVPRMLNGYANEGRIKELIESYLIKFLYSSGKSSSKIMAFANSILDTPATKHIVNIVLDTVLHDIPFECTNFEFDVNGEARLLQVAKQYISKNMLSLQFGEDGHKKTVSYMLDHIIMNECLGVEYSSLEEIKTITINDKSTDFEKERYYYAKALEDIMNEMASGRLIKSLVDGVLDDVLRNNNSLVKTLCAYTFDLTKNVENSDTTVEEIEELVNSILDGLKGLHILKNNDNITIDAHNICINTLLKQTMPTIKSLVKKFTKIDMGDKDIFEFANDFISKYMTESFCSGMGTIANEIILSLVTDKKADYNTPEGMEKNQHILFTFENKNVNDYGIVATNNKEVSYTYVSNNVVPDKYIDLTADRGIIASHIIGNFDLENPSNNYNFSFYTSEGFLGKFQILDEKGNVVLSSSTFNSDIVYDKSQTEKNEIGIKTYSNISSNDGIKIDYNVKTMPAYIPLIDLGVLAFNHTQVSTASMFDKLSGKSGIKDNIYLYSANMRDGKIGKDGKPSMLKADHIKNSVVFKNRHTVSISGLEAGKTYSYNIITKNEQGKEFDYKEIKNENLSFTTAPDENTTKFDMLAIADIQSSTIADYQGVASRLNKIESNDKFNYDFILNAGDMTDNGKNFNQWGWATNYATKTFANKSMLITTGNHEKSSSCLNDYFNYNIGSDRNSTTGFYYSMNYGSMHLIVLNTNDASGDNTNGLSDAQYAWLVNDLEKNDKKWTVVMMHKGLYTAGSHSKDAEVVKMRSSLTKLFAENNVDFVLAGHDHTNTMTQILDKDGNVQTKAIDKDGNIINPDSGVIYMTLGTLGNKFYEFNKNNTAINSKFDKTQSIMNTLEQPVFAKISIDGDKFSVNGYQFDAENNINDISNMTLSKSYGNVGSVINSFKVNGQNINFVKENVIGYRDTDNAITFDNANLPEGSKIQIEVNGKIVENAKLDLFEESKSFDVVMIDKNGNESKLGSFTLVREKYTVCSAFVGLTFAVLILGTLVLATFGSFIIVKKVKSKNKNSLN